MFNVFLFLSTALIWGSTWIAIKFQLGEISVFWSLAYRFGIAAVLLALYAMVRKSPMKFGLTEHALFMGLGALLFSGNYIFTYFAVEHLKSGLVAVGFSSLTIMNIINAMIFLRRPFEPRILFAALIGVGGIGLVFLPEISEFSIASSSLLGLALTIVAAFIASLGNTLAASDRSKRVPLTSLTTWGMIYGTIFITLVALASGDPLEWDARPSYIIALVYLAVFGTIIAFSLFLRLLARIGSERAGYVSVAFPVIAMAISSVFEGYVWTIPALAGLALVILGNYIVLAKSGKPGTTAGKLT